MTSWAPLDAASPPTVRIMIWSSDTPRASRIDRTFRSSRLRGAKPSVSQPTGSTSILSPLMPSLMYVSVIRYSQSLADRSDLQVIAAARREAVRVATYRQHLDIVSPDAIPDVCLLHPVGGDQDQRQSVQHLVVCRDITIGHEPWDGLHSKLLRV